MGNEQMNKHIWASLSEPNIFMSTKKNVVICRYIHGGGTYDIVVMVHGVRMLLKFAIRWGWQLVSRMCLRGSRRRHHKV